MQLLRLHYFSLYPTGSVSHVFIREHGRTLNRCSRLSRETEISRKEGEQTKILTYQAGNAEDGKGNRLYDKATAR